MTRLCRIIIPNIPHHVTQRGNRRQTTFFGDEDYQFYLSSLLQLTTERAIVLNAYCLMPNHVHLILTPPDQKSLTEVVAELHWRYTRYINFKRGWRGHLWQGRYYSVALSEHHVENCLRYVEENPLRANLVQPGQPYKWQSHSTQVLINEDFAAIREMTRTGRPQGDEAFLKHVESVTGINVRKKPPGRKPGKRD